MKLYTYWRSQATFRVRIALNIKGLAREDVVINLDRGDQLNPDYKAQNPQAVLPTLYDGSAKLFQPPTDRDERIQNPSLDFQAEDLYISTKLTPTTWYGISDSATHGWGDKPYGWANSPR